MVDRAVAHDAELRASWDGDGGCSSGLSRIVAAEVGAGHISDRGLRIDVVCRADIRPCRGGLPPDDERGESVCKLKHQSQTNSEKLGSRTVGACDGSEAGDCDGKYRELHFELTESYVVLLKFKGPFLKLYTSSMIILRYLKDKFISNRPKPRGRPLKSRMAVLSEG